MTCLETLDKYKVFQEMSHLPIKEEKIMTVSDLLSHKPRRSCRSCK